MSNFEGIYWETVKANRRGFLKILGIGILIIIIAVIINCYV
jgi:hypothetical protein